jgi:two-component system sensor histidine kinase YesM
MMDRMLKHSMFLKMMIFISGIALLTLVTLAYVIFAALSQSMVNEELERQEQAMDMVNRYMEDKVEWMQSFIQDVYRDQVLSQNLTDYLQRPYEEYLAINLDQLLVGRGLKDQITVVLAGLFERHPDLERIVVYSSDRQYLYALAPGGSQKMISVNAARSFIPDVMMLDTPSVTAPNIWVKKAVGLQETALYAVRAAINNPLTMQQIGQIFFYFDSRAILEELETRRNSFKGYITVLTPDGSVLFDSSGTYYGYRYPYMQQVQSLEREAYLNEASYLTARTQANGYTVVGVLPKQELAELIRPLRRNIALICLVCMAVMIMIPALLLSNYAKRTNRIVKFLRNVETGNLMVRLADPHKDELGQIAAAINKMVEELNRYIDRVYKVEIRQRQTELQVLQARINPHFLYNTLEVIRMRAVALGARDVAEMTYSLAMLFRNLVHPKHPHTLKDELEHCRLYLELFRIRYKDKFHYSIDCEPELRKIPVLRMLIQPVIENYVLHGLRIESDDNRIRIEAKRKDGDIEVTVQDNGRGMSGEKLDEIRQSFRMPEADGQSFGLRSVHQRLAMLYGSPYGVEIDSDEGAGTRVAIRFPAEEKGDAHVSSLSRG